VGYHPEGHVVWKLEDISADRAHQEQAFSRLQFIITYLDHAPAGFFSTLPGGRVDYLNATMAGWMGLDLAEAQSGKLSLEDLLGRDAALVISAVAFDGASSRTDHFHFTIRSRKGEPLALEVINRLDFDKDGKPLPARSMVLHQRNELRGAAGPRISDLAMAAPFGLAQINDKGVVTEGNGLFFGLSPQLKAGASLLAQIRLADRDAATRALAVVRAQRGVAEHVDVVLEGDNPRAVQFTFTRLADDTDAVTVFSTDNTESKSLEVQLAQSQKMQAVGQLASGIAHDFNNVLTPIIGFADLLLGKMRPTDPSFADIMSIKQNANRAANLVRQLLAFSRKQTMQPKVHSLTDAMSDLGNLLGRVLGEKTELSIVHGRDLGLVMVDVHQFEQVIINLAVNARDAMPQGGKLTVRTFNMSQEQAFQKAQELNQPLPPGDYVVCEVEDTGSGIAKEIVDKIWEPFFSTKDVGKGTGLGLSMVYGIIKQTGGYIYCDSVVGRGTVFSIYLPRHYPAPVATVVESKIAAPAKREDFTGKGRILVVEDEDSVRAFAVRALTSRGYTVEEANSGEVGLEVIENAKEGFELILSDVVMPEMDGPTFLSELRKRGIKTKFIFMSGYAADAFERNLENPNEFGFLDKPFSLKQLIEKVKEVMG
jgi:two-component system, cell cycle sensor histidine kinase and response regulator CckA